MHQPASSPRADVRPFAPPATGPADPLTGLATRAGLHGHLTVLHEEQAGLGRCGLLYVRVRGLERLLDDLGRPGVDLGIARCAAMVVEAVRAGDLVARVGPQEFVVACRGRDADLASLAIAPRIKLALSRLELPLDVTIGLIFADPRDQPEDLISRAEQAMAARDPRFAAC